jgi:5-(hydroxymethyl)furfural/furfural oxidase
MSRADVVVVGAGSAGCALAGRLSEDRDKHVVLLEAGPDPVPGDVAEELHGPSFLDAVALPGRTWPDLMATRAAGQAPRTYVRGRGVGGSSSVNAMVALPGTADDYDAWERDLGCAGWSWAQVAPWFGWTALELHKAPREQWGPVNRALAAVQPSAAPGALLTRDQRGHRVSCADAYLVPFRPERSGLTVRGDALVDRLLIEGRSVRGVRLASGEEIEAAEVIVAAGAIHSPALLLRSGIDTPGVGEGLHDHPGFPIGLRLHEPSSPGRLPIATLATLSSTTGPGRGDLQLLPMDHVDAAFPELALLMAALMKVHSRGRVTLASNDPHVDPVVELNMLSDERDVAPMREAIDAAFATLDQPAFRAVGEVVPVAHDDAAIRAGLGDYVHAAGSCAMGTVVDPDCRVRGYDGLSVCDASVIPDLPRANTHLPVVMIAERIAASWRARWREG